MPTLHDRFADLAEEAPVTPTPPGIWVEGRRLARVRRIGAVVIVAATLVVAAGIGGVAVHRTASPGYAVQPGAGPALPSRLYQPSRWLSTADGPPGQLSTLITAEKGTWTGHQSGLVGVSATTGAYHFLDLPDIGPGGAVLSPDGEHVAYALRSGQQHNAFRGVGVYDTVTGHLDRWVPPAGQGFNPNGLAWLGDDAVTFPKSRWTGYEWHFGHGAPQAFAGKLTELVGTAGDAGLYALDARTFFYLDPARAGRIEHVTVGSTPRTMGYPRVVSSSGRRIGVLHATQRRSEVLVGRVRRSGGPTHFAAVHAPLHWSSMVGWTDDRHLMVVNQVSPTTFDGQGVAGTTYALERVDVRTGHVASVVDMGNLSSLDVQFANGLLDGPTRDFPSPPHPLNPRVVAVLLGGVVLLGVCGLAVWRRRVRA
jgi:hypothetical protein